MKAMKKAIGILLVISGSFLLTAAGYGKTPFSESTMVSQKCSACHKLDTQGRLEVIEETRKSPEEWKVVVDRMTRLHDVPLSDSEFHDVIKELSAHLSLTPDEMASIAYINSNENSQYREIPANDQEKRIYTACVRCHTWGKMASHRYTKAQWKEIRILHLAYYPTAIYQMREMHWPNEFRDLIEPLSKLFPHNTPEWKSWMEKKANPDLSGKWLVAGYQPVKGYYTGSYSFSLDAKKGRDEYRIEKTIRFDNGQSSSSTGSGTLYSGYHLLMALTDSKSGEQREGVFDLGQNEPGFSGKWWTLIQDKNVFGNERFFQEGGTPGIVGIFPQSLKSGTGNQKLRIIAANLDGNIKPSDIRFSDSRIKAKNVERGRGNEIHMTVAIGEEAANGPVSVSVKGVDYGSALTVYDRIDGIRIFPTLGRARVYGGPAYPPQGVQFVARAVNYGKDGDAGTADDLILEPVKANWSLEEEDTSVSVAMKALRAVGVYPKFGRNTDDDLKYLKTGVENGLYTPITTYAPLKEREQHVQGTGMIAIKAAATIDGEEYSGRSRLVVTVPDYIPHIK